MASVLVRDLPDDILAELNARARRRGKSLQSYLSEHLARLARTKSIKELLAEYEPSWAALERKVDAATISAELLAIRSHDD